MGVVVGVGCLWYNLCMEEILGSADSDIWIDYDAEADVLYVSFRKPQQATDSELDDNVVHHYRDGELVGVTVVGMKEYFSNH